jgi:hypothetical protein
VTRESPERQSSSSSASSLWEEKADGSSFAAKYLAETSEQEARDRKTLAKRYAASGHLAKSIRMMWGNTQESTALLTALNYFSRDEPGMCLREVGMCGAGLDLNQTDARSSLLVGATVRSLRPIGRPSRNKRETRIFRFVIIHLMSKKPESSPIIFRSS